MDQPFDFIESFHIAQDDPSRDIPNETDISTGIIEHHLTAGFFTILEIPFIHLQATLVVHRSASHEIPIMEMANVLGLSCPIEGLDLPAPKFALVELTVENRAVMLIIP